MLLTLFFLSGVSGLIYQVVWLRKLALTFGVTAYALGVVLAAFMAGLAIGGAVGGWLADRRDRPLTIYAIAEIAIGVLGIASLGLLDLVESAYVAVAATAPPDSTWLAIVRFGLAFVVLLAPTVFMGATLPLIAAAARARMGDADVVSRLYAVNTAGAVVGALLAGFLFLGLLGQAASVVVAAALNIGAGVGLLALRARTPVARATPAPSRDEASAPALAPAVRRTAVLVFLAGGLTALAAEVVWARVLSVLTLGIVYGFSLTLAVVLTGIAAGSALYGAWARRRPDAVMHLVALHAAGGLLVAVALVALPMLGPPPASMARWPGIFEIARRCPGCPTLLPALLLVVFAVSLLSGAAFPAAARACAGAGPRWAARLGGAYAANVVGAVIGSVVGGFWLLPALGAHASLVALAVVNLVAAVALAAVARRRSAALAVTVLGAAAIAIVVAGASRVDIYRAVVAARLGPDTEVTWSEEGLQSSVAVGRRPSGDRVLLINGEVHADTAGHGYHRQLGHLGPLVHSDPVDALVIGLGGGTTAGTIALYPSIRVHVIELSAGVVQAARAFEHRNYRVLSNPRVRVEVGDGRHHLLTQGKKYDLIEGDILQPTHAGAGVVYSREYFELARRALKPGGIMVQWLGSPSEPSEYFWTARTFVSVFPHVTWWMGGDVAIGSSEPQPGLDVARYQRLVANPEIRAALAQVGLGSFAAVAALRVDAAAVPRRAGALLTDDRPAIEYFLTLPLLSRLTERSAEAAKR